MYSIFCALNGASIAHKSYQIQKALLDISEGVGVDFWGWNRRWHLIMTEFSQADSRALDREALFIKQLTYAKQVFYVFSTIKTLLRLRLLGPQRTKLGLPVAQDEWLHTTQPRRLPDLEVRFVGNGVEFDRNGRAPGQLSPAGSSR